MEREFWQRKWDRREIGFHEGKPNALLLRYYNRLDLPQGAHVFVPLCGKTADIPWLLTCGYTVSGVEIHPGAVQELFQDMGLTPHISAAGNLVTYTVPGLTIHAGDVFDISPAMLGTVDAVYDRAALVALPDETRAQYARHVIAVTARAPQLLVTYEYDQRSMNGPPFSVDDDAVRTLYGSEYSVRLLHRSPTDSLPRARGASEALWHLGRRSL